MRNLRHSGEGIIKGAWFEIPIRDLAGLVDNDILIADLGKYNKLDKGVFMMKWEDIKHAFKEEWVLLEVGKIDEEFRIIEGEVLAHSKDKNEIYKNLIEIKPKEFMIEYTGDIPEDLAIVLIIRVAE